ncbi:very long chain fatty acid elongase AAEL008004-like isoform X2 [Ornithodoros turicata]
MTQADFNPDIHWFPEWDPRTEGWAMTGSPYPLILLCILYVYVVRLWGPRWMASKKPFEIRGVLLVYNLSLVMANLYFVCSIIHYAYFKKGYRIIGQGVDFSTEPNSLQLVHLSWWYYMMRLFEFFDTFFFVLRKKYTQVSTLHVFHHVTVAWNMWMNTTYGGQGQTAFVMIVNSFVHTIMYSYYFLAAAGPSCQKHLWWKKQLTQLQLAQFTLVSLHSAMPLFIKDKSIPGFTTIMVAEAILFLVWFLSFYARAYRSVGRKAYQIVSDSAAAATEALVHVATSCSPDHLQTKMD